MGKDSVYMLVISQREMVQPTESAIDRWGMLISDIIIDDWRGDGIVIETLWVIWRERKIAIGNHKILRDSSAEEMRLGV